MTRFFLLSVSIFFGAMSVVYADISVQFVESAPKDSFTIRNQDVCTLGPMTLTIDLSGSAAGLIFDPTEQGAGVNVAQPFELVEGREFVTGRSEVSDGGNSVRLDLTGLPVDGMVRFTIDVDDTLSDSRDGPTRVNGTEIEGASILADVSGTSVEGQFNASGLATIDYSVCLS